MNFTKFIIFLVTLAIFSNGSAIAFPPPPASATCRITCRVAETVEWSQASFEDIDLGELNSKHKQTQGQSSLILYTNGDVEITADNSENAELSNGAYKLQTQYKLDFDAIGGSQTGAMPTEWCTYDTFLKEAAQIIHSKTDGNVVIILSVKADIDQIRKDSGGEYYAMQTLTVCWKS
ncbi:MAG: hypothetical protein ABFD79_13325 [Phycisphaerales bacterium]